MSIFSFAGFAYRNPSYVTRKARRAWKVHKAMQAYRFTHTECAWCGRTKKLDVHHITPVSVAPERADDLTNMLMLCRKGCHIRLGHAGNWGRRYVENVKEACAMRKVIRTRKK